MQRIKGFRPGLLCGCLMAYAGALPAVTIEEIAVRNNRIIELDQEIAIAEKNKKLIDIKNSSVQPETIALPRLAAFRREENIAVIAVHGTPANPIVDVQYGNLVMQRKLGDVIADGWLIAAIGNDTVTFRKKVNRKPDLFKTTGIGHGSHGSTSPSGDDRAVISAPAFSGAVPVYPGTGN